MKECQNIEWKESWNDDYLKWICAFANTEGGSLCIGIDDKGNVFPLKNEKKLLEDLPNKIRDVLGIIADVRLVSTDKGDYIRIDIPAYPNLINYHGRFYYRSGSTTQELKGSALERMILKKRETSWDAVTIPNVSVDDLSEKALSIFKEEAIAIGRLPEAARTDKRRDMLQNLDLIVNGELTRAAILMFHPTPEKFILGAVTRIAFFRSEADIVHQDEIRGPLFEQIAQIRDIMKIKYLKAYISFEGFLRKEEYLFPEKALRESILNSVIHKNYSEGLPILIKVFESEIRFYNPGVMPEDWTVETLMKPHISRPHNPLIASTFFLSGEIETWGRGIQKIVDSCRENGLAAPVYEYYSGSGFGLFLNASDKLKRINEAYAGNADAEPNRANCLVICPEDCPVNLPEKLKVIFALISATPSITYDSLAEKTGVSRRTVQNHIRRLKEEFHLIIRKGSDKSGHWEILKSPDGK